MRKIVVTAVMGMTLLHVGAPRADITPQQGCDRARVKAWGKYLGCVAKVEAKGVSGGSGLWASSATCRPTAEPR